MSDSFLDGRIVQHCGDVREQLRALPADHFDCVVTSPPYWGLRDYGVVGQLGLERTLGEHLAVMVEVFREVRRVLKPTGTMWINYGDCYATTPNGRSAAATKAAGNDDRTFRDKPFSTIGPIYDPEGGSKGGGFRGENLGSAPGDSLPKGRVVAGGYLKPKDLVMVPNRLAIALQDAGWWVRSEIIWHKSNPMPESIKDRPGSAHEKIWLLSKSERYFYDAAAIAEECTPSTYPAPTGWDAGPGAHGNFHKNGRAKDKNGAARPPNSRPHNLGKYEAKHHRTYLVRNARNVWTMATEAFSEAHFATFPTELAERCIKAGSPQGGVVLDPFGGAGTTALAAVALGRSAHLIELNPEYCALARARIEAAFMSRDAGARHMVQRLGKATDAGPLFEGLE